MVKLSYWHNIHSSQIDGIISMYIYTLSNKDVTYIFRPVKNLNLSYPSFGLLTQYSKRHNTMLRPPLFAEAECFPSRAFLIWKRRGGSVVELLLRVKLNVLTVADAGDVIR